MSEIRINTEVIKSLNPCRSSYRKWLQDYPYFDGDILEFLELELVAPEDKVWLALRVLPRDIVEVFAVDCAIAAIAATYATYDAATAATYADATCAATCAATYATYATYAATYAADAADATCAAARRLERENQVDALIMLINDYRKGNWQE